jgi:NADH-ubiquinone oxidoreductase chain 6
MLINIRISELLRENHNDIPLAILTVIITYYFLAQVLPTNLTDNTVFSRLSNSFTEIYNMKLDNEFVNMLEFKQIGYASSKG